MADFVAVIRRAVDNLSENTPANRARVYDKARAAIRRQLEAINPQPTDEVIAKQLDKLDFAIEEVELEHAEAVPDDMDDADALMAELESMVEKSPVITEAAKQPLAPAAAPAPTPTVAAAPAVKPTPVTPVEPKPVPASPTLTPQPASDPDTVDAPAARTEPMSGQSELVGDAHDEVFGLGSAPERRPEKPRKRAVKPQMSKGGIVAVLVLLLLGAVAFAGYSYKDTLTAMLTSEPAEQPILATDAAPDAPEVAAVEPEPEVVEPSALAPEEPATTPGEDGKFTQRLAADGTETDVGPAPGPAPDDTVEGRSVAELTDAAPADETVAEAATADAPVAPADAAAPASQPLGVTQKMILYEERLGQQSLEAKPGTVVWTLVSEPSGDGPDEQVIRGEINNPEKGLSALITIKRNTDASLPASHIVEVVFALPADFDGGSIDQLQRISMKQTEADQGNPLIAVPAKITQDFYMVALNDLAEAREANTNLLRNRSWIDIPVVYANGRQALITLEKGASGTEVFNQALDAWAKATPAQ